MADQDLLKYARVRDDISFVWRVSAALTVKAQYMVDVPGEASAESLAMRDWVLENPMQPIDMMIAFAATMPEIAEKVVVDEGAVSTAEVLDSDITYIVNAKWDAVAKHRFGAAS